MDTTMGIPLPEPTNPHAYLNNLLDTQRRTWELVDANITAAQERQQRNFRVHQTRSYKIGDMVYLHCPGAKQGCRRKLNLPWRGPCVVVQVGDENNYVIRDVVRNKKRRIHYNRLKPCYRREQVHEEVIAADEAEDSIQGAHRETQQPTGAREDWGVENTSEQDDEPLLHYIFYYKRPLEYMMWLPSLT